VWCINIAYFSGTAPTMFWIHHLKLHATRFPCNKLTFNLHQNNHSEQLVHCQLIGSVLNIVPASIRSLDRLTSIANTNVSASYINNITSKRYTAAIIFALRC
jgi:hypothetical protein